MDARLNPEQAFSHPFITKAVYELKGMRVQSEASNQKSSNGGGSVVSNAPGMQVTKTNNNNPAHQLSDNLLPSIKNQQWYLDYSYIY